MRVAGHEQLLAVPYMDPNGVMFALPSEFTTSVSLSGPTTGAATLVIPFCKYIASMGWKRAALLVHSSATDLESVFVQVASDVDLKLTLFFLTLQTDFQTEVIETIRAITAQRHSLLGVLLPILPSEQEIFLYKTLVNEGLTDAGNQLFFSGEISRRGTRENVLASLLFGCHRNRLGCRSRPR